MVIASVPKLDYLFSSGTGQSMRGVCARSQRRSQSSRHKETRLFFCEHCNETLSKTQFFRHRRLYLSDASKTWSNGLATARYSVPDPFLSTYSSEDETMTEQNRQGKHDTNLLLLSLIIVINSDIGL